MTTSEERSLHVSWFPSEEEKYIQISHQVIKDKKKDWMDSLMLECFLSLQEEDNTFLTFQSL